MPHQFQSGKKENSFDIYFTHSVLIAYDLYESYMHTYTYYYELRAKKKQFTRIKREYEIALKKLFLFVDCVKCENLH